MRAIAALLVVLYHAGYKASIYSNNPLDWFHIGGAGVDLFFIISGFIMCYTVDNKKVSLSKFLVARVKRIIPLYWVLTSFALLAFILFPDKVNSSGGHTGIAVSYFLIPTTDSYLIKNGWTLSYEFFYYFLFSMGLFFTSKLRYLLPAALIISLVAVGALVQPELQIFRFMTDQFLLEFAFGIFVFYLYKKQVLNNTTGYIFLILGVLAFIFVNQSELENPRAIMYGLPTLLFFIGMISLEPSFQKKKNNLFLQLLGNIGNSSYSLYLLHPFVLVAASIILVKLGLAENGYLFVALLTVSSIIGGHLCYLLLEKNLQKMVKFLSAK